MKSCLNCLHFKMVPKWWERQTAACELGYIDPPQEFDDVFNITENHPNDNRVLIENAMRCTEFSDSRG